MFFLENKGILVKKMILGCVNFVCVFSDNFEYILKYNKEKG